MPYDFTEWEKEPEPQTSSSRSSGPPRKLTGIGVLDPPVPPKRQPGPLPAIPASTWLRIFAAIVLIGIAALTFLMLLSYR
jgi:hypothetical protein